MYSNYKHYENIFSNNESWLYETAIERALDRMEHISAKLDELESITDFESEADYERNKADRIDYNDAYAVFADLVHSLGEALEMSAYIDMIEE